jgi:hypothetical protein
MKHLRQCSLENVPEKQTMDLSVLQETALSTKERSHECDFATLHFDRIGPPHLEARVRDWPGTGFNASSTRSLSSTVKALY